MQLNCTLVANPERAKEPELAYRILSQGMKDGWYVPSETLSKYINGNNTDYNKARKIVNPNDFKTYEPIERYAKTFEAMLRATMFR